MQPYTDSRTLHGLTGEVGGSRPRAWRGRGLPTGRHYLQEHYDQLHRKINHTWDLVVMQAREQLR